MNAFATLSPLAFAILVILVLVALLVGAFLLSGERMTIERRLDQLEADRRRLLAEAVGEVAGTAIAQRARLSNLARLFSRLRLISEEQTEKTGLMLLRAGYRSRDAVALFVAIKLGTLVLGILIGVVLVFGLGVGGGNNLTRALVVVGAALAGTMLPDFFVQQAASRRRQTMQKGLPDALDLLVIGAEAGMSLDQSLDRVARELMSSCPPLAEEMALLRIEMTFLPDRRQALTNFGHRVDLQQARGVVTTMLQSDKYGTSLAESLRVLSAEFRTARLLKAEEKAARLPAVMTVPLILFILPTLMLVLIGPAIILVRRSF